jgi:hypothetical protein
MAFIRLKKISGAEYAVLVENEWTSKGPRQKVKQYLGKFLPLDDVPLAGEVQTDTASLIRAELYVRDFSEALVKDNIKVNLKLCSVRQGRKRVVLGLNGGFLCDYTLRRVLRFVPVEEVTPGYALARAFSDAGIRVSKPSFVAIYTKIYKKHQAAS